MDYERILDESLLHAYERLKNGLLRLIDEGKISREDAARLLPELRESEDERIRKAVVSLVYEMKGTYQSFAKVELDKMVAWLEKQKEQKPVDYDHEMWKNCEANFEGGKKEVIDHPEKYGLRKEQKPAEWSEEDTLMLTAVIQTLENFGPYGTIGMQIDWLKSLCPQSKAEWCEEDERIVGRIQMILEFFDRNYPADMNIGSEIPKYISWLKSLRPSWKPSEQDELMKLKYAGTSTKLD